jgi:hypothetical protein
MGAALCVGTLGTWVRAPFADYRGTDVRYWWVAMATGVFLVAGLLVSERTGDRSVYALGVAGCAVALGYLVWVSVRVFGSAAETRLFGISASGLVKPGWGLFLAYAGAIGGAIGCLMLLGERRTTSADASGAPSAPSASRAGPVPTVPTARSTGAAPGWYPDPHGEAERRWWDGRRWTEHTA